MSEENRPSGFDVFVDRVVKQISEKLESPEPPKENKWHVRVGTEILKFFKKFFSDPIVLSTLIVSGFATGFTIYFDFQQQRTAQLGVLKDFVDHVSSPDETDYDTAAKRRYIAFTLLVSKGEQDLILEMARRFPVEGLEAIRESETFRDQPMILQELVNDVSKKWWADLEILNTQYGTEMKKVSEKVKEYENKFEKLSKQFEGVKTGDPKVSESTASLLHKFLKLKSTVGLKIAMDDAINTEYIRLQIRLPVEKWDAQLSSKGAKGASVTGNIARSSLKKQLSKLATTFALIEKDLPPSFRNIEYIRHQENVKTLLEEEDLLGALNAWRELGKKWSILVSKEIQGTIDSLKKKCTNIVKRKESPPEKVKLAEQLSVLLNRIGDRTGPGDLRYINAQLVIASIMFDDRTILKYLMNYVSDTRALAAISDQHPGWLTPSHREYIAHAKKILDAIEDRIQNKDLMEAVQLQQYLIKRASFKAEEAETVWNNLYIACKKLNTEFSKKEPSLKEMQQAHRKVIESAVESYGEDPRRLLETATAIFEMKKHLEGQAEKQ